LGSLEVQKFGLANTGKETGFVKQEEKSAKSLMKHWLPVLSVFILWMGCEKLTGST
jgi:hypothetical protein